jgi:cell division septum initiation protein DivIVA
MPELLATLEALQRENETLKQHVEELQEKIDPEKDCACSYDEAGAVCAAHSPMLKAAEAEVKRLREALTKINEGYGPNHMSTYCRFTAKEALASAGEEHHADK